jgi:DNA polymerase III epsilon subunit-like protein
MENQTKNWTYLVLDLEMTWLNPFQHGVIEVAAIVLDDFFEIVWDFHMDLLPPDNVIIDPLALEYNWFTLDRIALGKSYEEFCDPVAYLQTKNDGSAQDLIDLQDDVHPASVRSDDIHLTTAGYQHIADMFGAKILGL